MGIIMEVIMAQMDQGNKKESKLKECFNLLLTKTKEPLGKMVVAMIMILVVIAILLIQGVISNNTIEKNEVLCLNAEDIFFESSDERLINFIKGYFSARTYLDFLNIYKAFDKDYLFIKDTDEGKIYDNGILYEKNYVSGYNNIKVYEHDGLLNDEKVVLVTYDMGFYFSDQFVPSIIVGYIKDDGKKIYFKDNLDIGESKYISSLMEAPMVKGIYNDIKNRLEVLLTNDINIKLAYNSLRQYDMNPNNDMMTDRDMLIEKIFGDDSKKEKELINLARQKEEENEKK